MHRSAAGRWPGKIPMYAFATYQHCRALISGENYSQRVLYPFNGVVNCLQLNLNDRMCCLELVSLTCDVVCPTAPSWKGSSVADGFQAALVTTGNANASSSHQCEALQTPVIRAGLLCLATCYTKLPHCGISALMVVD